MLLIAFILMYCLGDGILKKIGKYGLIVIGIFFTVIAVLFSVVAVLYFLGFRPG